MEPAVERGSRPPASVEPLPAHEDGEALPYLDGGSPIAEPPSGCPPCALARPDRPFPVADGEPVDDCEHLLNNAGELAHDSDEPVDEAGLAESDSETECEDTKDISGSPLPGPEAADHGQLGPPDQESGADRSSTRSNSPDGHGDSAPPAKRQHDEPAGDQRRGKRRKKERNVKKLRLREKERKRQAKLKRQRKRGHGRAAVGHLGLPTPTDDTFPAALLRHDIDNAMRDDFRTDWQLPDTGPQSLMSLPPRLPDLMDDSSDPEEVAARQQARWKKQMAEERAKRERDKARLERQRAREEARREKQQAKEEARRERQQAAEEARLEKQKAREEARLEKQQAQEQARLEKQQAKEEARQEKQQPKDEARREMQEAREKAKREEQAAREEARLAKQKAKEEARREKQQAAEEARLAKQQAREATRLEKRAAEERARRERQLVKTGPSRQGAAARRETRQRQAARPMPPQPPGLLSLPAEVRLRIYRELLVAERPILVHSGWRVVYKRSRTRACDRREGHKTSLPTDILRACRLVHREAVAVLYGDNRFHYRLRDPSPAAAAGAGEDPESDGAGAGSADGDESASDWELGNAPAPRSRRRRARKAEADIDVDKHRDLFRRIVVEAEHNRFTKRTMKSMARAIRVFAAPAAGAGASAGPEPNIRTLTVRVAPLRSLSGPDAGSGAGFTFVDFFAPGSPVFEAIRDVRCQFLRVDLMTRYMDGGAEKAGGSLTIDRRHELIARSRDNGFWANDAAMQKQRRDAVAAAVKAMGNLSQSVADFCNAYVSSFAGGLDASDLMWEEFDDVEEDS